MTELEKTERDIETMRESIRLSTQALNDLGLSPDLKARERASMEANQAHLAELLALREALRAES